MRYGLVLLGFCAGLAGLQMSARAEDCNTDCTEQCRITFDTLVFGRQDTVEPTCHLKCETAKKASCILGQPIPNVPLTIKEQVDQTTQTLCGLGFYAFGETVSAKCSNWDARLEDQDKIEEAKGLLLNAGYFTAQEFDGIQIRWCPLNRRTGGIAPDQGKIYLHTGAKNAAPAVLAALLAHEMQHQRQYRSEGVDQFRCDYSRKFLECGFCQDDRHSMEREAYDLERKIRAELAPTLDLSNIPFAATIPEPFVPTRVFVEGFNGPSYVQGVFEKTGPATWAEKNTQSQHVFNFTSLSEGPEMIVLHDGSRNLILEINLESRITQWKVGNSGVWNRLYDVTGFS